jgi:hypothetical protein
MKINWFLISVKFVYGSSEIHVCIADRQEWGDLSNIVQCMNWAESVDPRKGLFGYS